ncbi:hypothetical protein NLX78_04200 [Paenibacillus sp. Lou8.1]|uniref:hypothetical protein n=1 Tax=Paenibacillus sp. Lou8.1 TaxID=2962041 RepID=UPI0020B6FBF5|nr:hypothetical protein [Paenibacillus sp. Lou8.1]MCP3806427.1 hypothetical protein [Paenibacillus sp. Lou8.1]
MSTQPRFAFLSSDGILHLHDEEHAKQHGKYVPTSLTDDESGYPVIEGQGVVFYAREGKAYVKGNKADGKLITTPPALQSLQQNFCN